MTIKTIGNKLQEHINVIEKRVKEKDDPKSKEIASAVLSDGTLVEMIYDKEKAESSLAVCKQGKFEIRKSLIHNGITLKPHSAKKIC